MKKNHYVQKVLSFALILTMITCCTACGSKNKNETNHATETGTENTYATDGSIFPTTSPEPSTDQITDGTDGIIGGVVNDVMH